jgi:deoxycytidylate deaminase
MIRTLTRQIIRIRIMRFLKGSEEKQAMIFIEEAAKIAQSSSCLRSKCGSIIVRSGEIIGKGFNSPPLNKKPGFCIKDQLPKNFKSDKTCCIHAEQRAIMDALKHNPEKISGSRLYFIRLDESRKKAMAGKPYCTICSKMALEVGISEFVLLHREGICVYGTEEYNRLSFEYREDK